MSIPLSRNSDAHMEQYVLRCDRCGHTGNRTFVDDGSGGLIDVLNITLTPDACACSACRSRLVKPVPRPEGGNDADRR